MTSLNPVGSLLMRELAARPRPEVTAAALAALDRINDNVRRSLTPCQHESDGRRHPGE